MQDRPNRDARLREAIEACRPGHDDLGDQAMAFLAAEMARSPQVAQTYQRLKKFDSQLARAISDVPVPPGLAERILLSLPHATDAAATPVAAADAQPATPADCLPVGVPPAITGEHRPGLARANRRRWLLAGMLGMATAASLLAAFVLRPADRPPLTATALREVANELFRREAPLSTAGRPLEDAPAAFPFSRDLTRGSHIRWRPVDDLLNRDAIAYDLARPGQPRATLYVVRLDKPVSGLPLSPPAQPALVTHNLATSAWQTGSLAYVLVVEGSARDYQSLLLPVGPLA